MDFQSEIELRRELGRYLKNQCSLKEFEVWFVPRSWNFDQKSNPSLRNLVAQIELSLAEFNNGDWTENELRQQFGIFMTTCEIEYRPFDGEILAGHVSTRTGTGSSVLEYPLFAQWPNVDIRPAAVSA
jgi:hypothetical protein